MVKKWNEKVYPHGDLLKLAPRLWQVTGSLPRISLPRNMVVYRLDDGGLLIHSGIALNEAGMSKLESLGAPKVLVVPNRFHRMDAMFYKERYPKIQVVCPAAARKYVKEVIDVHGDAEEVLPGLGIQCHVPKGIKQSELTYELDLSPGKALVFTDILFNLKRLPRFTGWSLRIIGSTGFFGITRIGRFFLLEDRKLFKPWLMDMAAISDLHAIFVAHGDVIVDDCNQRLREAAERL